MKSYTLLSLLLLVISAVCYTVISNEILSIRFIYWLPYGWLVFYLIWVKIWIINKPKLLIMLHFSIVFSWLFCFILYRLGSQMEPKVALDNYNAYREVNSLFFKSEDALYIGIYLAVIAFFVDLVYFIGLRSKRKRA